MSRRGIVTSLVMGVVVAATIPVSSSPATTQARWHDSVSVSVEDAVTDRFTSTANDVPADPSGITESGSIEVTNTAERHQAWVDLEDIRLQSGALGGTSIANDLGLAVDVTAPGATCSDATTRYWNVAQPGGLALNTTYSRAADRVASSVLNPTQSNPLCLELSYAGSDRAFLLKHAGRDIVTRSKVSMASEAPATWNSSADTVNSTFRVAFPRATPWGNDFGDLTNSCRDGGDSLDLRWAWPDATQKNTVSSPAVNAWELWVRPAAGGPWQKQDETGGSSRSIELVRRSLARGSYDIKIIARLDSGGSYWVEGTHILSIEFRANGRPDCTAVRVNNAPNTGGPVVLP